MATRRDWPAEKNKATKKISHDSLTPEYSARSCPFNARLCPSHAGVACQLDAVSLQFLIGPFACLGPRQAQDRVWRPASMALLFCSARFDMHAMSAGIVSSRERPNSLAVISASAG